jgi:quercetin dioxygenase-like cupin family protein
MSTRVIGPGGGEIVGDSPERRVEILSDDDALHATWSRFAPGRDGADLHVHRRHSDLFYVLEGELTVRLGTEGETAVLAAGALARVPPLVVHGFRNGSDAQVRYLNLHAPGRGFADFMRGLRDGRPLVYDQEPPPADGALPTTEAVVVAAGARTDLQGKLALLTEIDEIAICEARTEPGDRAPTHMHRRHVESLYVLEGELVLVSEDRELRVGAGSWAQLPRGITHAIGAGGGEPARFLSIHTPSCGLGDFLRELSAAVPEELAAARAGFDAVYDDPRPA